MFVTRCVLIDERGYYIDTLLVIFYFYFIYTLAYFSSSNGPNDFLYGSKLQIFLVFVYGKES